MKFKTLFKTILITFLTVTVFSCSDDDDTTFPSTSTTIIDFLNENQDYSSLLAALEKAELVETLSDNGPFTVFAPNNEAFNSFLDGGSLDDIPLDELKDLLLNHVLNSKVTSDQITTGYVINRADFSSYISKSGSEVKINDQATVTTADIDRFNGVIHAIDKVINIPKMIDFVSIDPNLSSLATVATDNSATVISALSEEGGSLTLLAPNNDAFTALGDISGLSSTQIEQVLLNHAISGKLQSTDLSTGYGNTLATYGTTDKNLSIYINTEGGVEFNGISTVSTENIVASNGVIHIVDTVITLPTVVTFATADANFSTLVEALTTLTPTTDFVAILNTALGTSPAPFTVFAPNNDAFAAITIPTDENNVAAILNHHVVAGSNITSDILASTPTAMTLNGTITLTDMPATVKGAANMDPSNIIAADVQASNGVIHVIDQVLLPVM